MASYDEVSRFIQSSFRSVWSLELVLLLKRDRRSWKREEIIASLRASELIVSQGLDQLAAAGLVAVDAAGEAAYAPVTKADAKLVDAAEALYARSPDAVRRIIVGASTGGLTAFADAFRLRRD